MTQIAITILFFLSFLYSSSSAQQSRILQGRVIDESGQAVAYASITFKGFSYGTKTDENGIYRALILPGYDSIICTHVNYKQTSIKIEGNNIINFILENETLPAITISIDTTLKHKSSSQSLDLQNGNIANDKHFEKVEISASFPGGEYAFRKYLKEKLFDSIPNSFPPVKGVVKFGFTISKDGSAKDFILLKGVNDIADRYVLLALSKMPKWIPALQNGPSVEQYREVAVSLNIQ